MITFIGNNLAIEGRSVLEPLFDEYEDLMDKINNNSSKGLNKGF